MPAFHRLGVRNDGAVIVVHFETAESSTSRRLTKWETTCIVWPMSRTAGLFS